jgi:hypothetical protein
MATLVRKYNRISGWELVYELISREETFQTLGVEVPLMGQSTMATWSLVRGDIKISMVEMAVFLLERMLEVEETSQTATRTRGNTLGVGEMSTMATIETHSTEAYMDMDMGCSATLST